MIDTVALRGVAENNNGHCDRCGQSIKFYRYKVSGAMCRFLVAMAKHTKATGEKNIDITALGLTYSTHSQATKLRLHGLIARVKNERGVQIANHWLITRKGYQFLAGEPIPARVIVYNRYWGMMTAPRPYAA